MEYPFEIIEERLLRIEELLLQNIEEKPVVRKVTNVKELMSVGDLAEYLNFKKSFIYKLRLNHEIPYYKTGKKLLFRKNEIDEWVKKYRRKSRYDIEQEALEYTSKSRFRR